MAELTAAQERYLAEIRATGPAGRKYNGRARRPLRALRDAGLIALDEDMDLVAKGGGTEARWTLTAVAIED